MTRQNIYKFSMSTDYPTPSLKEREEFFNRKKTNVYLKIFNSIFEDVLSTIATKT